MTLPTTRNKDKYKQLNKVYSELSNSLTPEESRALKAAQLEWLKYRDAEFKLIDQLYSYKKGSMNVSFNMPAHLKSVKSGC
ncbi:MAG: lysozyme inhibitor LprI family protein [Acidobacteriota bacterium]